MTQTHAKASQNPYRKNESRRNFVAHLVTPETRVLEIGALNTPMYRKKDARVEFVDWQSQEDLIAHYPYKENIQPVDHIVQGREIAAAVNKGAPGKFDLIIANHVVEHIPDLIYWLQQLRQVATPEGRLFMAVPDRRYTFDLIRNETDVVDLIDCYRERLEVPSYAHILKHLYFKKKITAKDIWAPAAPAPEPAPERAARGVLKRLFGATEPAPAPVVEPPLDVVPLSSLPQLRERRLTLTEAMARAEAMAGEFHSLHCHVFTMQSFADVMGELSEASLVPWKIEKIADVPRNANEFLVLLKATEAQPPTAAEKA